MGQDPAAIVAAAKARFGKRLPKAARKQLADQAISFAKERLQDTHRARRLLHHGTDARAGTGIDKMREGQGKTAAIRAGPDAGRIPTALQASRSGWPEDPVERCAIVDGLQGLDGSRSIRDCARGGGIGKEHLECALPIRRT
jgi:hypothetical protein